MKKTILFGLAGAALLAVGCTNDETVEIPATKAITFANAFVDNNTKADPTDPSTTVETLNEFGVFGYVTKDGSSQIFDNKTVESKDKGATWTYTGIQYWIDGGEYVFSAVSPSKGASSDLKDKTTITTTVSDFASDGNTDLVYATAIATGQPTNNPAVALTFKHLLSKVRFTFVNNFATTSNISLNVTDVTITNAVTKGTVVTTDGTTDETDWDPTTSSTDNLEFGNVETLAPQSNAYAADEKLLIPTTGVDYNVTFTVQLLQGGVNGTDPTPIDENKVTATIKGQTFLPGFAYNITATLTSDNVNPDAKLEPIVFTVSEIEGWQTPENDNGTVTVPEATTK
jgi:hypothetical protein